MLLPVLGQLVGAVPTFFIGIDHVAQFTTDHSDAGVKACWWNFVRA
jgi:hypothetical protein